MKILQNAINYQHPLTPFKSNDCRKQRTTINLNCLCPVNWLIKLDMFLQCTHPEGRGSHIHNTPSHSGGPELEISLCGSAGVQFPPPFHRSEQQAGATGSVSRVHQIAAVAVSSSVYLSKLCGCHPASQAAIAWPPPLCLIRIMSCI